MNKLITTYRFGAHDQRSLTNVQATVASKMDYFGKKRNTQAHFRIYCLMRPQNNWTLFEHAAQWFVSLTDPRIVNVF